MVRKNDEARKKILSRTCPTIACIVIDVTESPMQGPKKQKKTIPGKRNNIQ